MLLLEASASRREARHESKVTVGLGLAKNAFVRPASRVSFCFTEEILPEETRLFHQPFPTRHAKPVRARCEALGTT